MCDYPFDKGRLIVKEMLDLLCLDLVEENLVTKSVTLHIGYSNSLNMKSAHGTASLPIPTSSDKIIIPEVTKLYDEIVNPYYPIRRINISFNNVIPEEFQQYNLFIDTDELLRTKKAQQAMITIKKKFGKNLILKGMNLEKGATTIERNSQIGGHKSGE